METMETLSPFVICLFVLATFFTVWQFYRASGKSKTVLLVIAAWMVLQSVLGLAGFFQDTRTFPPRFVFLIGPAFVVIVILFVTSRGKQFIDSLDISKLTSLHIVRVPVEITLYYLFVAGLIPVLMTFHGYNPDIISGITAAIVYGLVFIVKKANKTLLLVWNFLCLGLLINILAIAILSVQTPFQMLAFDQPNVGVMYFPFVWLPGVIVPIVLLSHLASIKQLLTSVAKEAKSSHDLVV